MPVRRGVLVGKLLEALLENSLFQDRLQTITGEPLSPSHVKWLAAVAALGGLAYEDGCGAQEMLRACCAALLDTPVPWLPNLTPDPTNDLMAMLNAAFSYRGRSLQLGGLVGPTVPATSREFPNLIAAIDHEWSNKIVWPGHMNPEAQHVFAGLVALLHQVVPEHEDGADPIDTLRNLELVRDDTSWISDRIERFFPSASSAITEAMWGQPITNHLVLEAEPTSDKTRAALIYGLRLWQEGRVEGIAWFLPNRLAAAHVFERVTEVLGGDGPTVVLALPFDPIQDGPTTWLTAPGWFTDPGRNFRGMAAPIVITTMEQALLSLRSGAGLQHTFTRLAWLSRQAIFVDGILPFDWRNVFGGGAVIRNYQRHGTDTLVISSGLDAVTRNLLDQSGGAAPDSLLSDDHDDDADHRERLRQHCEESMQVPFGLVWDVPLACRPAQRRIHLEPTDLPDLVRQATSLAQEGQRVLIVHTTNRACVTTAMAFREAGCDDLLLNVTDTEGCRHPAVLRSHYTFLDRRLIDESARIVFARERTIQNGTILVSTPLIDSASLYEFDVVFSDLAPMDVLLRRVSLLAPGGWLRVISRIPGPQDGIPDDYIGRQGGLPSAVVYQDLSSLWTTQQWLEDGPIDLDFALTREYLEGAFHPGSPLIAEWDIPRAHRELLAERRRVLLNEAGLNAERLNTGLWTEPFGTGNGRASLQIKGPLKMRVRLAGVSPLTGLELGTVYIPYDARLLGRSEIIPDRQGEHVTWRGDLNHVYGYLGLSSAQTDNEDEDEEEWDDDD